MMWVRAFAVLFELRARIIANFNSRTLETIKSARDSENAFSPRSQVSKRQSTKNSARRMENNDQIKPKRRNHGHDPRSPKTLLDIEQRLEDF